MYDLSIPARSATLASILTEIITTINIPLYPSPHPKTFKGPQANPPLFTTVRFYGVTENSREAALDMREMVDKVKRGEAIYGKTELTDYMQGVAARNSRYTGVFLHVVPMFNFVNHNQHGIDTAKYYQQAERELEAERLAKGVKWTDG